MPITIQPPTPLGKFGPGLPTVFQSDQQGPLPSGSSWNIRVYEPTPGEKMVQQWIYEAQQTGQLILLGDMPLLQGMTNGSASVPADAQVVVQSEIQTPLGTFDTGKQTVTWDGTTGVANLLQMYQQGQTQAQGGLTEQEHTWLETTQQAVQRVFTDVTGAALSNPIGALIAHPDMSFLDLCDSVMTLSGRGELTRPAPGVGVNAYGLALGLSQVPPGFGTRDGSVLVYSERLAQFITMHAVKGGAQQWLTEELDLHIPTMLWLWRTAFPARILFDVTPGCALVAQWVCARL